MTTDRLDLTTAIDAALLTLAEVSPDAVYVSRLEAAAVVRASLPHIGRALAEALRADADNIGAPASTLWLGAAAQRITALTEPTEETS